MCSFYRFYGRFELLSPVVEIRDLELVKKIAVKDFDNFPDRRSVNAEIDVGIVRSVAMLTGKFVFKGHKI